MKRLPLYLIIAVVVICGIGLMLRGQKPPDKGISADATTTVDRGDLDSTIVETGTVNANQVVELKSLVSGRLMKLNVDVGDHVTQGQLIAIIDPRETQLQVDQLRAQVKGAQSSVEKARVDLSERQKTVVDDINSARTRLAQARAELDAQPSLTKEAIRQAETSLNSAKAEKSRLVESAHPTTRSSSKDVVKEAEANVSNAEAEIAREEKLLAKGFVSQKVLEDARLNYQVALSKLQYAKDADAKLEAGLQMEIAKADEAIRQAQASLRSAVLNGYQDKVKAQAYLSAQSDLSKAEASRSEVQSLAMLVKTNQATVEQISAQLRDGERNLSETNIYAPISGFVTKKEIQIGELVTSIGGFSSGTPIVRIEDRSKMKVALQVNEIDSARMKVGMESKIGVDALPNNEFKGKVTKISPASTSLENALSTTAPVTATDAVVKYDVEIEITNAIPELKSGMSTKCSLNTLHVADVVKVPSEYVGTDGASPYVMVLPNGNLKSKPEKRPVKIGETTETYTEIKSGVKVGDVLSRPEYKGPKRKGMFSGGGPND